ASDVYKRQGVLIVLLMMVDAALCAVGGDGISGSDQSYLTASGSGGIGTTSASFSLSPADASQQPAGGQGYPSGSASQTTGPYQERMSPSDLGISPPQAESFRPDESLGFVSASLPSSLATEEYGQSTGYWYYPGSITSSNRFYVQTTSGLKTVGGCRLGGYLPLWADIRSGGNLYVYEWYPDRSSPAARWWGWTWPGYKKGWFTGDSPGWHILCYSCAGWSNYVYIYVYPESSPYQGYPDGMGYSGGQGYTSSAYLQSGAPTPPDLASEQLMLPDHSLYRPATRQGASYQAAGSFTQMGCPSCATRTTGGVSAYQSGCTSCGSTVGITAPQGYIPQSYNAVYPRPSSCRCNEYYVQTYQGGIGTVAGVYCGDGLSLWSKISRSGTYWSFEWTVCGGPGGSFCSPDIRNFGHKSTGWYQTWFSSDEPGWHILSYHCNDWSNYIYIYVWPAD
ncbi:MAG: hypothetical protein QUS08_01480, partial [Methanothrix sp.]|nr:hypothetical protein [Methanothrix sp.]